MPRNKYPEETVKKILDVSLKLFLEQGYEQTTILDIVNNLGGLTRGAFYHHFKSKEEVLSDLGDKIFAENNFFKQVKFENGLTGLEKLRKAFELQQKNIQYMELNRQVLPLIHNPRFLAELVKACQELAKEIQPLIEEGIADGSIKNNNAKLLSEVTLLLCNFWMIPTLYPSTSEELYEKAALVKNILDFLGFPLFDTDGVDITKAIQKVNP